MKRPVHIYALGASKLRFRSIVRVMNWRTHVVCKILSRYYFNINFVVDIIITTKISVLKFH
jgi:hypothetical protein